MVVVGGVGGDGVGWVLKRRRAQEVNYRRFCDCVFLKQRCAVSPSKAIAGIKLSSILRSWFFSMLRLWVSPSKAIAGSKLSSILRLCVCLNVAVVGVPKRSDRRKSIIVNFAIVFFLKQRCAVSAVSPLLRLWVSPSKAVAGSKLSPILRLCVGPLSLSR